MRPGRKGGIMSFMSGMSAWDKNSMAKGQKKIQENNEQAHLDFCDRVDAAIEAEESNPDPEVTSVNHFCAKYSVGNRCLYKSFHAERLQRIKALPYMRGKGNPHGWKKNAWWVKDE